MKTISIRNMIPQGITKASSSFLKKSL